MALILRRYVLVQRGALIPFCCAAISIAKRWHFKNAQTVAIVS
jgi:hypothetical protein